MTDRGKRAARTDWILAASLAVMTTILVLQNTKQAMLPKTQTPALWTAEGAMLAGAIVLRSGWGRDSGWKDEQARLGTLANNFYPPRRDALISGFAVALGVLLALWWGAATWSAVLGGMRRGVPGRGLLDFEVGTVTGALTGGVVGAAIGLAVGHAWERRHRRGRRDRQHANV
jgi:hypothetical protein